MSAEKTPKNLMPLENEALAPLATKLTLKAQSFAQKGIQRNPDSSTLVQIIKSPDMFILGALTTEAAAVVLAPEIIVNLIDKGIRQLKSNRSAE